VPSVTNVTPEVILGTAINSLLLFLFLQLRLSHAQFPLQETPLLTHLHEVQFVFSHLQDILIIFI
jgi:hypothetical protein